MELDAYLKATGLDDCELTAEDEQALAEEPTFAEFKLGDVFDFKAIKQAKSQRLIPSDDNGIPYVVQSTTNNMVSRTVSKQWLIDNNEAPVSGNAIVLGVTLPAVSYQPIEFGASQVIVARNPNLNERNGLYIASVLTQYMEVFSYTRKPGLAIYKAMSVMFPVIPSANPAHVYTPADIDWGYMERYIAELEEERVAELEEERVAELDAYLKATGLDDCELTTENEQALAEEPIFAEFKVGDVFGKALHTKYHNPKDLVLDAEGYPYICASNANNGINKDLPRVNGDDLVLTPKKIIAWGKQCPMFCVHSEACVTSQGMYFLDMTAYSDLVCLYICSALDKACSGKFGYSNCLIGKVMDEQVISLPVIPSADPAHVYTPADIDWRYMEHYIRATEKLVIADVVAYKNRVIAETKRIVCVPASPAAPAEDETVA